MSNMKLVVFPILMCLCSKPSLGRFIPVQPIKCTRGTKINLLLKLQLLSAALLHPSSCTAVWLAFWCSDLRVGAQQLPRRRGSSPTGRFCSRMLWCVQLLELGGSDETTITLFTVHFHSQRLFELPERPKKWVTQESFIFRVWVACQLIWHHTICGTVLNLSLV